MAPCGTWDFLEELPESFFYSGPEFASKVFPRPTLIHLRGEKRGALLISTLLHGNETTGYLALQNFIKERMRDRGRDLLLFIGNVEAAGKRARFLPGQTDFNRIWGNERCAESEMAGEILRKINEFELHLCVDIHNTTGKNPFYVAAPFVSREILSVGSVFSRIIVEYDTPQGTFVDALRDRAPAFVLECGQSGNAAATTAVYNFLVHCLSENIFATPSEKLDVKIYKSFAKITASANSIDDIEFVEKFDEKNFTDFVQGELFCRVTSGAKIEVVSPGRNDLFSEFFEKRENRIFVKKSFTPSLLTMNKNIAINDAIGYIMKRKKT